MTPEDDPQISKGFLEPYGTVLRSASAHSSQGAGAAAPHRVIQADSGYPMSKMGFAPRISL